MATTTIKRHITGTGDQPIAAAAQPLYVKAGKRIHYNVAPGQFVAYLETNPGIPQTIAAADITAANVHKVRFAVGHSSDGVIVDSLRHLGVEGIGNCDVEHISVASPKCGSPAVKDLYFDCVNYDDAFTIAVGVDDNFTRSYAPLQKSFAEYIGSFKPGTAKCDDCDSSVTCTEVAEGLVQSIRQDNAPTLGEVRYPDYRHPDLELPFEIVTIKPVSEVYCIAFSAPASECEECNQVSAITEVTVGGVTTQLVGTTVPGDATQTSRLQLESVVDQINDALGTAGHAYLTGNTATPCCPLQLHVNRDTDGTFEISDGTTALTATESYNPFGVGQVGEGFTCGIRVIAAPITGSASCYIEKPLAFYGRDVRIQARGEGFIDTKEVTVQNMELPGQFGTLIQYMELYQTRGGSGRTYSAGYNGGTWTGVPRSDSRIVAAPTADANSDYCSYYIRSRQDFYNPGTVGGKKDTFLIDSYIHVPSGSATTIAALEPFLDKWATLSTSCMDTPTVSCTPLGTTCA